MVALYVEIDDYAALWLENLIRRGVIAPGDVHCGDMRDVRPRDLSRYRQVHLFAGIGVWSYALRRAGIPDDANVWTFSEPCQPFSAAGKGLGFADERYLRPYTHHLVTQCRPAICLGEQVASGDGLAWLDVVQSDMEDANYAGGAIDTCSAGFGAPHIRQRLRLAYASAEWLANAQSQRRSRFDGKPSNWAPFESERQNIACSLADANLDGLQGSAEQILCGAGRRIEGDASGCGGSPLVERMGKPDGARLLTWRQGGETLGHWSPADAASRIGELADADGRDTRTEGLQRGGQHRFEPQDGIPGGGQHCGIGHNSGSELDRPGPTNGFWSDADWLHCRDGKWRPVEPGTFPLAHGAPSRVGRLRAYGNAVDGEATTEFCAAVRDTFGVTSNLC